MKIGVLTGGGDCSGLNAVIRAVTKSAMYHFGWQVVGIQDGFQGITSQPPNVHVLDLHEVSGILDRGGTILGASNRGDPFNYPMHDEDGKPLLDEEGKQIRQDISDRLAENMRSLGIKALVVVGGDGTMRLANRLHVEKGMNIVGVPKTIDNDLGGTDITFGFNTATQIVTDATDRLHSTAESHHRVMIIETMGRYAGHIALNAGLAGGADIILIPEIEWTVEKVAAVIKERRRMGRRHTIITVGEGAKPKGGQLVTHGKLVEDSVIAERLGGIGHWLREALEDLIDLEVRVTVMGHTQRGGTPTAFDRNLGTLLGHAAVLAVHDKKFGQMVAIQGTQIVTVPLDLASRTRPVDPDSEAVRAARGTMVSFGD